MLVLIRIRRLYSVSDGRSWKLASTHCSAKAGWLLRKRAWPFDEHDMIYVHDRPYFRAWIVIIITKGHMNSAIKL